MRRSKQTYLAPLLAAAAVLVACSSEEGSTATPPPPDGGASAPVTPEAACEHQFRVSIERCIKDSIAPATMTSARERYVADCVTALGLSGSTRTADEVDACASAVEAEECGIFAEALPACAPKAFPRVRRRGWAGRTINRWRARPPRRSCGGRPCACAASSVPGIDCLLALRPGEAFTGPWLIKTIIPW